MANFLVILAEEQEKLRKSNLANLAHAYVSTKEHIARVEATLVKMREHLLEIEKAGENHDIHVDDVKKLYDKRFVY